MAEPESKTQDVSNEPIFFTLRKAKPDIRFYVFDQEYHVHSAVLKVGSEFFQNYLEPAAGVTPTSTSPLFKSDWYTKVDDDGSWYLSSDGSGGKYDISKLKGSQDHEQKAFHKLLCVIFNREYEITDAAELNSMTEQADYYRALPALSNSVNGIFFNSPGLLASIGKDPVSLLVSAYKLRHKTLFRECYILCLGPWSKPRYKELQVPFLFSLADNAYSMVNGNIEQLWAQFIQLAANSPDPSSPYSNISGSEAVKFFFDKCSSCISKGNTIMLPKLFRSASTGLSQMTLYESRV